MDQQTDQGTQDPPAVDQAQQPWQTAIFGDSGAFVDGWQSKLPTELDPYKACLANFKDIGGLAKALHDNMAAARAKPSGIIVPASDADDDTKAAFRAELNKHLGVPENPDGYTFQKPDAMPPGMAYDEALEAQFKAEAHKMGLSPEQAQAVMGLYHQRLAAQIESQAAFTEQYREQERKQMAAMWGSKVDETLRAATRAAVHFQMPDAAKMLDPKSEVFVGPAVAQVLAQMAAHLGEERLPSAAATGNMDNSTLASDISTNPNNPEYAAYHDMSHPNHRAVALKVLKLNGMP